MVPAKTFQVRLEELVPDPATADVDAADVIGFFLATADAPDGAPPADVLASIDFVDVLRLLLSAMKVGGSLVRDVPQARGYLVELAAGLRGDDDPPPMTHGGGNVPGDN